MLEGLVASLLNRFLGMYVRNFDPKQLNVGIWSGDVTLRDMELRKEALDQLHLPINVVEGHVGLLTLSIPWSNLKGKPVKIFIENVYVLAAPREDAEYSEEEETRRQQALKLEKLESAEMIKNSEESLSPVEQQKNQSFTESLVTKIIDNLQVSIKNIHVRYEDALSAPGHPFALGVTLEELSAVSTDDEWRPTFIQTSAGVTYKLATLGALAVYWDTDASLLGTGKGTEVGGSSQGIGHEELMKQLQELIPKSKDPTAGHHQFILKPVNGRARVEMNKTGKTDLPKAKATLEFEEIGVVFDGDQYRDALMMIDLFHYFIRHQEYKKYWPKAVSPKEDPRAWLQSAGNAVLSKIHERNRQWTWAYIKERRDDRKRYIELFKKKKRAQQLTAAENEDLQRLEWKWNYQDLRFWRSLARSELRKENVSTDKPKEAKPKQGWLSWAWGSGKHQDHDETGTNMTEQQREELYKAIEWDEKAAIAAVVDAPRDSVKLQVGATLNTGSFTLRRDSNAQSMEILSLLFDDFRSKLVQRPDSFLVGLSLGGLRAYDGTTEGNLFSQFIKVKDDDKVQPLGGDAGSTEKKSSIPEQEAVRRAPEGPFFEFEFEQNPLDDSADSSVTMKLKSMEVIYNPSFVVGITKFFKPPERHMESIGALMETAGATVEGLRQQTRAGLEFALEEHKTINANFDLQAPVIMIPENVTTANSICMILDAGHVSMKSELVDKDTLRDIQSKRKQQYNDEDVKRLESLMYDKFLLKLEDTQVLIGPSLREAKSHSNNPDVTDAFHLIDRISMDFTVESCILPKDPNLTRFRISGHLPILHVSVSDLKYKQLMRLVDTATPKFEEEQHDGETLGHQKGTSQGWKGVENTSALRENRHSNYFQRPQDDALSLKDGDTDDEHDEPEDRKETPKAQGLNIHQRNLELKFTVDKLQGSLFKADPNNKEADQLLVELVAQTFQFNFYQRPADFVAEISLQSINVDDHIERELSSEFQKIVSSDVGSAHEHANLLNIRFVKVSKDHPDLLSTYEGIETNIDVDLSTLSLIITRKTLLTLLDFIMSTFTNAGASPPARNSPENDSNLHDDNTVVDTMVSDEGGKTRVKIALKGVELVLNNDGLRLASLNLHSADVAILLLNNTMRVTARLGNLSLLDDINQGASSGSTFRQLIAIQGEELADFRYETFDPNSGDAFPGYNSFIFLRAGSIKIHFVEEPFRKIVDFFVKFGRMQAIFNAARQAAMNQANQIQENADKMRIDIVVKTPIVVFPKFRAAGSTQPDVLTAYLGEIYAQNTFVTLNDSERGEVANKLSTGIRHIRLTSDFYYNDTTSEELEIIDNVDLNFKITYVEHNNGKERPSFEVEGGMTDFKLRLTQIQMKFLLAISKSVPAALTPTSEDASEEQELEQLPQSVGKPAGATSEDTINDDHEHVVDLRPELGTDALRRTKVDLIFKVPSIGLELVSGKETEPVGDVDLASLSKFFLEDTSIKMRMTSDNSVETELLVHAFTARDSRARETNKFRKIMASTNKQVHQLMASMTMSGGVDRNMVVIVTMDSPRIILALDYLFAIQNFIAEGLVLEENLDLDSATEATTPNGSDSASTIGSDKELRTVSQIKKPNVDSRPNNSVQPEQAAMSISFRANVVDAHAVLIANPTSATSEAIVLSTKQILVSQQHALTLQVSEMGMYLCRMDQFEANRLRILDDFSLHVSMQTRSQGKQSSLTSVHIGIEPLVLRVSLRDILLAVQIVNKASELSSRKESSQSPANENGSSNFQKNSPASGKRLSTVTTTKSKTVATTGVDETRHIQFPATTFAIMKREELIAELEGLRMILIGDLHELPLLDVNVHDFTANVRDWSGQMNADTSVELYCNIYNFSKSVWEPLIEPWQLGFHLSKSQNPDHLSVDIYSRKTLELTITSASISMASKSAQFLYQDEDVLSKPRGVDAPYRVRNYTGFDMSIWANAATEDDSEGTRLTDGAEAPWRFEDWEKVRENLTPEGNRGTVGIRLEGSGFDSLNRIPVTREGEVIYNLRPKRDAVVHRLLVEVKLGAENVKYITFRSPLLVENKTQIPIELGVFESATGNLLKIEKVPPDDARPAPVGAAFMHSLLVRPDQGFGYAWSEEGMHWQQLLKKSIRQISCKSESGDKASSFFFQMSANYDRNNPLARVYPYMRICLSAPLELQNLLPYDFKYRIYDKDTKKDWTNFLRKGGLSPVHVVELSHLLLLSVHMQDTVFKQSEFAIINSNDHDDYRRENKLVLQDNQGLTLNLRLHYFNIPNSGGAFRVAVYSPYIILNKTGLEISIKSKAVLQQARSAAGQGVWAEGSPGVTRKALPLMFSYANDERQNRAILKVGDSGWSKPQSLDAIGSAVDVELPSSLKGSEVHLGLHIKEGEGKYKMTKVVILAPRFVMKNKLLEDLNVRESTSSRIITVGPSQLSPLYSLRQGAPKQLCLCFPGSNNQWSSPFNISDLGSVHVKVAKAGERQKLIRVEIMLEQATIFLHFSLETKHWPFSMRNESDTEFMFFQANPYSDEEIHGASTWQPIRYRLPPRSIMPYAWDYPAAERKEIVLCANGKERHVSLAEIGNLLPMKIPPSSGARQQKIIEMNVAADGPTQTLILSNYKQAKSLYRQKPTNSSQSSSTTGFEVKNVDSDVTFKVQMRLAGIGISLINRQLRELAYLTFRDIELKYSESLLYQTFSSTIKWIQIDNQLYGGIFPLLLYPSVVPKTGKEIDVHPNLHAMVTRVKDDSYGVLYIKYATILLQQMTLEIDEDFIFALLDFSKIPGASWSEETEGELCDEDLDIPEPRQEHQEQDIYFELLHIQPAQLDLSFVRTERVNVEDKTTTQNPLMFFLNVMTMAIGNINDAPVRLNALMLENARVSLPVLLQHVQSHYSQEFLYQVHKILGSADFLGNPVGLFNNISSGVADIFYEPYQGLVMTDRPQELGIGIARGATSFVKKSVFGVTDSMSKFTGSISKGLAAATLDKQFQDRRRMTRARNRPKHALYGVTEGANSFVTSVASGVGGLARKPLEGAEQEGVAGFFKGVGKGMLGLATKPAIGVFDLASNVTEGIRNTTTVFDNQSLDRVRLPRFVGKDGIVRPYSQREALGQYWLKQLDNGKYFDEEYIAHLELPREDVLVMLTYNRIMLVKAKRLTTEWDVPLKDIQTISKERTGLSITLKGGTNGPYIPVHEESSRNFLYRQIGIAVKAFNEKYLAKEQ